jgi:hypothetical protein
MTVDVEAVRDEIARALTDETPQRLRDALLLAARCIDWLDAEQTDRGKVTVGDPRYAPISPIRKGW